jgi:hypothetical protein
MRGFLFSFRREVQWWPKAPELEFVRRASPVNRGCGHRVAAAEPKNRKPRTRVSVPHEEAPRVINFWLISRIQNWHLIMCKLDKVFCSLESMSYKLFSDLPLDKKTGTKGKRKKGTREKAKRRFDIVTKWRAILRWFGALLKIRRLPVTDLLDERICDREPSPIQELQILHTADK